MIALTHDIIDTSILRTAVARDDAGAILVFEGTTRDHFEGKAVLELRYEAYETMARSEMLALKNHLEQEFPQALVAMIHRLGVVAIGETSVAIAVSAPHRDEAYLVSRKAIDMLKEQIPIWKKEIYSEGGAWKANQKP